MEEEALCTVATEQLHHFSHEHALSLVRLQLDHNNENSDTENDDEDKDDLMVEEQEQYVGKCKMCKEEIYTFHQCYYSCKDCDYSLHIFCAQLPTIQRKHPLHPGHNLTLSLGYQFQDPDYRVILHVDAQWICDICKLRQHMIYNYHCSICNFTMDIICATKSKQKMDHPSHPHQLQRDLSWMTSPCYACGEKHSGTFYHCKTCYWFRIHLDCALLPSKLLIQQSTNESFSHPHLLALAYSFPHIEYRANFYPKCRVCEYSFHPYIWHYRCNKCRYYVHIDCATSKNEAFMSILMPAGLGKNIKNFKEDDYPKLIRCPFPDESISLVTMHQFINKGELNIKGKIDGEMFSHNHPLILYDTHASLLNASVSLHDPMKKVELFCDGCVRPVTTLPFYKCSQHQCGFILHEWCTRLPSKIQDHPGHPEHALVFLSKFTKDPLGLFSCKICELPSNGFAYGCMQCEYYVDLNCAFIPDVITHEAHPNHLLLKIKDSVNLLERFCKACAYSMNVPWGFHCPTCDFYLHPACALSLPRTIKHKHDTHSLSLRYGPVENHISEYFCEICEDEFDPQDWFYHCSICASSMHTACAPIKLQCEKSTNPNRVPIYWFLNVKFGRTINIADHPHPLTFEQGINDDGSCVVCHQQLQHCMIFKCFRCRYALHCWCPTEFSTNPAIIDA